MRVSARPARGGLQRGALEPLRVLCEDEAVSVRDLEHVKVNLRTFVHLNEIDDVGLEPLEAPRELFVRGVLGAPVELGHEEGPCAVAVAQGLVHPERATAIVVVPTVVEEGDAVVDRHLHHANAVSLALRAANVVAPARASTRRLRCDRACGDRAARLSQVSRRPRIFPVWQRPRAPQTQVLPTRRPRSHWSSQRSFFG
jgi:hypothetical protein